jgi:hypothetical protein
MTYIVGIKINIPELKTLLTTLVGPSHRLPHQDTMISRFIRQMRSRKSSRELETRK